MLVERSKWDHVEIFTILTLKNIKILRNDEF